MNLEQREKRLLEALYERYGEPDDFPTFAAKWVEQEGGRRYFHVTGEHRGSSGEMIYYDHTISRGAFLQLEQEGYIRRDDRGAGEFSISITDKGIALVESDFGRA